MRLVKLEAYKKIYAVDSFEKEYTNLFGRNADFEKYKNKLHYHLQILDDAANIQQVLLHKDFEIFQNVENGYIIRYVSKLNPRTVFFYAAEDNIYILLHSFLEKTTKPDYKKAANKVNGILKELGVDSERGSSHEYT